MCCLTLHLGDTEQGRYCSAVISLPRVMLQRNGRRVGCNRMVYHDSLEALIEISYVLTAVTMSNCQVSLSEAYYYISCQSANEKMRKKYKNINRRESSV